MILYQAENGRTRIECRTASIVSKAVVPDRPPDLAVAFPPNYSVILSGCRGIVEHDHEVLRQLAQAGSLRTDSPYFGTVPGATICLLTREGCAMLLTGEVPTRTGRPPRSLCGSLRRSVEALCGISIFTPSI